MCYRLDVGPSWAHSRCWVGCFYLCLLIGFVGLGCLAGVCISVSGSVFLGSLFRGFWFGTCGFAGLRG